MRLPIKLRRVVGSSMEPNLKAGKVLFAKTKFNLKSKDVVIIKVNGREVVKRIKVIDSAMIYVLGDNPSNSTDSRDFGWLDKNQIVARVVWPKV